MFKDEVKIKIESGKGGWGSFAKFGGRDAGGNGGNGADVYLRGNSNILDLSSFSEEREYKGKDGNDGQVKKRNGDNSRDYIIEVPLITELYLGKEMKYRVTKHGEMVKILTGGKGQYGNAYLRKEKDVTPSMNDQRRNNQYLFARLVLKLQSDIIFIGYPNAGKSTMLNMITNADVKVAPYPFTTVNPQLGLLGSIRLMDLPGLIDDTHIGKGLGTSFLKHTKSAKLIAHFVSLEEENPYTTYSKMREELKKIDIDLYNLSELVILSKSDVVSEEKLKEIQKEFKKNKIETSYCSIIDMDSVFKTRDMLVEKYNLLNISDEQV